MSDNKLTFQLPWTAFDKAINTDTLPLRGLLVLPEWSPGINREFINTMCMHNVKRGIRTVYLVNKQSTHIEVNGCIENYYKASGTTVPKNLPFTFRILSKAKFGSYSLKPILEACVTTRNPLLISPPTVFVVDCDSLSLGDPKLPELIAEIRRLSVEYGILIIFNVPVKNKCANKTPFTTDDVQSSVNDVRFVEFQEQTDTVINLIHENNKVYGIVSKCRPAQRTDGYIVELPYGNHHILRGDR